MTHRIILAGLLATAMLAAPACTSSRKLDESLSDLGAGTNLRGLLFADRAHDYADVSVTIYEGRVLLTGAMRTEEGKQKVVDNARRADGVREVIDEIKVGDKISFGRSASDARIGTALRSRLLGDGRVYHNDYRFDVSEGVVYMIGAARTQESLDRALELARSTRGVKSVVSHVLYADYAPPSQ